MLTRRELGIFPKPEGKADAADIIVRQMCLSADLVPQSFIDEMRSPPSTEDNRSAVTVSKIAPEKQEELITKLRQAVADNEECPVSCLFHRMIPDTT